MCILLSVITKKYKMQIFNCAIFLFLAAIEVNSFLLTKNQQKCLINLTENLFIKQIVIVSEFNKFDIRFIKNFQQFNIFTKVSHLNELNESISNEKSNIFKPKTLYLLDFNLFETLPIIFIEENEFFLSKNVWVIFNKNQNFKRIYIPYNCQFIVIDSENDQDFNISEIYNTRIYTRDFYISNFAKWDEENNLQIFQPDFYQRRFNMNNTFIGVINDYLSETCPHIGVCAYEEIIKEMARMLNFRPNFMHFQQLKQIWEEKVELSYEIWISLFVFDTYTYWNPSIAPIWKTPAFLHIKYIKQYEQVERSPHLRPFEPNVWFSITLWLFISGICVAYIDHKIKERNYSIINSIFRSFESFTNQCGCMIPNAISSRMAAIMTRAGPALLIPLYSAVVISFVTVKIIKLPFTDLHELVEDGSFKFGYENNTLIGRILRDMNNPNAKIINEKFLFDLDKMPISAKDAVKKICTDPKLAFAYFNNDIFLVDQPCKIIQIPKPIYNTWDAIRLRRRSPYYTILNRILKSFRSSGVLKRMEKIVYAGKPNDEDTNIVDSVEYENISQLLMAICCLYLIVPIILIIEILVFKKNVVGATEVGLSWNLFIAFNQGRMQ